MPLFAGDLDRRITFVKRMPGEKDGLGAQALRDVPMRPVWASVKFVSDGERMQAMQPSSTITHRFQVRYSTDVAKVDARDAIQFGGMTFEIVGAPKELGRREGLEFSATARADNGQR